MAYIASSITSDIISSHYTTNYTLYHSHLLISLAISETQCGCTQLSESWQPWRIIPCHPRPMLLESRPFLLTNSFSWAVSDVAEWWWWALCLPAPLFHHTERLLTTPEKTNTCTCGAATSAGSVKSCASWPDQVGLYNTTGSMPSQPGCRKHYILV